MRTTRLITLALGGLLSSSALAGPRDFAIYATRIGGDSATAQPYVDKFLRQLESVLQWPAGATKGAFLGKKADAIAYIESQKPGAALLDPALYFELRASHALELIGEVQSKDLVSSRFHVVVKDPAITSVAGLKGKRLWSMLGDSPKYLSKVVLGGQLDVATDTTLKPIGQPLKGVRGLLRGDCDATTLDDEQLAQAKTLEGGAELKVIYSSPALTSLPLVFFGKNVAAADKAALQKAFMSVCTTGSGPAICAEMHLSGFVAPNAALFTEVQKRYGE
jgi:hypothetical protein